MPMPAPAPAPSAAGAVSGGAGDGSGGGSTMSTRVALPAATSCRRAFAAALLGAPLPPARARGSATGELAGGAATGELAAGVSARPASSAILAPEGTSEGVGGAASASASASATKKPLLPAAGARSGPSCSSATATGATLRERVPGVSSQRPQTARPPLSSWSCDEADPGQLHALALQLPPQEPAESWLWQATVWRQSPLRCAAARSSVACSSAACRTEGSGSAAALPALSALADETAGPVTADEPAFPLPCELTEAGAATGG